MDDTNQLYQMLGEITESIAALGLRMERMERRLESMDGLDVLQAKMETMEHDMAAVKALPGRFMWAVALAAAAGIASLLWRLLEGR
jgi:hypothetical protein